MSGKREDPGEAHPLLADERGGGAAALPAVDESEVSDLYRNFLTMCAAFALNHGSVTSCLAYATAELGNSLGGVGSGVLYVCYALTAFLLAKPVVSMVGPKTGLLIGVAGYCVYIGGFLFAVLVPALSWPVFILACAIGGVAGGLLWPSQGRYFARNAKLYSELSRIPVDQVNSTFAGIFAANYLGFEMVTKVLATVIFVVAPDMADYLVFTVYTIIAVASVFSILSLRDLSEYGTWDFSITAVSTQVFSVATLVTDDLRLMLMIPFQVAFGFCSSFVPYYVLGTVIAGSSQLGTTWVGLLSAIIVATGAVTAIPSAFLANKLGKPIVMTIGGVCLSFAGFVFFFLSDTQLGTWALIIPYLIIYGFGRGTWENTNKAVIADLFSDAPEHSTSAFAAVSFSNGFAGAIGYFTFSSISRDAMASVVTVASVIAIVCYWVVAYMHSHNLDFTSSRARIGKYNAI
jgi:MFS family permease